jgi:hypothetical protein
MKKRIFLALFLYVVGSVSTMQGCGSKDAPEKAISVTGQTQTQDKQDPEQSKEDTVTPSLAGGLPGQPTAGDFKSIEPAAADTDASLKAEPLNNNKKGQAPAEDVKMIQSADRNPIHKQQEKASSPAAVVQSSQEMTELITIENEGYPSKKKGPVKFTHTKHNKDYGVTCDQCHHLYKDGQNQWKEGDHVDKCIFCHSPIDDKDKAIRLQNAFHKNCRECHNEMNKSGRGAPSVKCSDCHGS